MTQAFKFQTWSLQTWVKSKLDISGTSSTLILALQLLSMSSQASSYLVKAPTLKELAEGAFFEQPGFCPHRLTWYVEIHPRHSIYEPKETLLFYGFVIPRGQLDDIVSKLYRELVDPTPGPVTNGFATLYVSECLEDLCDVPYVAFETVRRSRGLPAQKMVCIGDSLRPFWLETKALSAVAEKLGMQPNDAEWCFADRKKEHVIDYARDLDSSDISSINSLSTTESVEEPLTDHDGQLENDAYVVHARESMVHVSHGCN